MTFAHTFERRSTLTKWNQEATKASHMQKPCRVLREKKMIVSKVLVTMAPFPKKSAPTYVEMVSSMNNFAFAESAS